MTMTCKSCVHWTTTQDDRHSDIVNPSDPDSYMPMVMPFEVRRCDHPQLQFCERPVEPNGFAVADGSTYFAALYTAEEFGCVRYKETVA